MTSFLSSESIYAPPRPKKPRGKRIRLLSATHAVHSPARKRQCLTNFDKLYVLDFYHKNAGKFTQEQRVIHLRQLGYATIVQGTLSRLLKQEKSIRELVAEDSNQLYSRRQSTVKLPEVDAALTIWVLQKIGGPIRLTGDLICAKGRHFCQLLGVPDKVLAFSHGWLDSFKARLGLSSFVFHGEGGSSDPAHIEGEQLRLQTIIALYMPWDVYNFDETGLFFRAVPTRGYSTHRGFGFKSDKTRITYGFCANLDGSDKRSALVIGKARRPHCFKSRDGTELGFNYFWQKKAWMVESIWKCFLHQLNDDMKQQNRRILLLCDNAPSHIHEPADYPHVRLEFLAPNMTPWVQPMDAGIIRCFKAHYKRLFMQFAIEREEAGVPNPYHINQLEAMQLAAKAWDLVSPTTISNCWRHTKIIPPQYATLPSSSGLKAPANYDADPEAWIQRYMANHSLTPFQQLLAEIDEGFPTEHEWTDEEIVEQVHVGQGVEAGYEDEIEAEGYNIEANTYIPYPEDSGWRF